MERRANLLRRLNIGPTVPLKDKSRQCLRNLARFKPTNTLRLPLSRSAAVLVALFVGRMGDLYVLLSRRSSSLKSYAGDTSLPGGRWETGDTTLEATARREAYEEIGLPQDQARVPLLCVLEPFLAGNQLIVTPVVVLVTDLTLEPILNSPEVTSVFSHPLNSFLHTFPPFTISSITPPTRDASYDYVSNHYYSYTDVKWNDSERYVRLHRFLTGKESEGIKPVFGLTAAIMVQVASIGYERSPSFHVNAIKQPLMTERIAHAMRHEPLLQQAARQEALNEWLDNDPTPKGHL